MAHCSIDPPSSNVVQADMPSSTVAKEALMPTGMFMGVTMLPLPENLHRKILNLEYVEMADLRPEAWMLEEGIFSEFYVEKDKGYINRSAC